MKQSEVTYDEKRTAHYIFDMDERCGNEQKNHWWYVTPRSGKMICCMKCGKKLRNGTKFARSHRMMKFGACVWYWKLVREERNEQERADFLERL